MGKARLAYRGRYLLAASRYHVSFVFKPLRMWLVEGEEGGMPFMVAQKECMTCAILVLQCQ